MICTQHAFALTTWQLDCFLGLIFRAAQVLSTHPGPPLNALLRHPSYLVTCNLCSVIASAADEYPAMQRLLRLDGVITTVMQALEERAAAISVGLHADEHPAEPALLVRLLFLC